MSINPNRVKLHAAMELLRRGLNSQAAALLEELLAEVPNDVDALNALGAIRYEEGKLDEARTLLSRCLATDPKHALASATLGEIELRAKNPNAAVRHFEVALASNDPGLEKIRRWIGVLLAVASGKLTVPQTAES